ncbi:histidine phosphatase family protein [Bacillus salacetis]|uniref:Histidine phosphatase family protein n=1 Tax=Bacillus salacetis TaxID=2315464 RepID=A0A3A1QZN3_9BACI|nr:histidine phosphatase family protein [Bacillus salacetis]RIW34665.1 histidine phosphatase family protein [Bacillus salacetis]
MKLIFIRHGQGEHTLDLPGSLQLNDPGLTLHGQSQAAELRKKFNVTEEDIIIASPVRRTLETASIFSNEVRCSKVASPLVSPRMFPQKPEWNTLPCDTLLTKCQIRDDFPSFSFDMEQSNELWEEGINTMEEEEFRKLAIGFMEWCRDQGKKRVFIVSHDGTITSYRQLLSGTTFTRDDFLKETGWIEMECPDSFSTLKR